MAGLLGAPVTHPAQAAEEIAPSRPETAANAPLLLGIYPQGYMDQPTIAAELTALDAWSGKQTALTGLSLDIAETPAVIPQQLEALWNSGYTAFINLAAGSYSQPTAYQIASGIYDAELTAWAEAYAGWAATGRWAFIAILPEMNTPWVSYGMDAGNYKLAYAHIRQIILGALERAGAPADAARWVFAPNAWFQNSYSEYYPGGEQVDVAAFSMFHFGACNSTQGWKTPAEMFAGHLAEMRALAPGKPIFISRLATSEVTSSGVSDPAAKNEWLRQAYAYLAGQLDVRAVLYYNIPADCAWPVFKSGQVQYPGYPQGVAHPYFGYAAPAELRQMALAPAAIHKMFTPGMMDKFKPASVIPILLGIYPQGWPGLQSTIDNEFRPLDTWAGKGLSLGGTFIDIVDPNYTVDVKNQLEMLWNNGYTPFVNLTTQGTAYKVASGQLDNYLKQWATAYKAYATGGGGRMAFIAPLQEMNGDWTPWGGNPANFKAAYWHIQQVFSQQGVPAGSVKWVFAPNGWNDPGMPDFEEYYPGDSTVDVVSFSAYNFGHPYWDSPDDTFTPFLQRMTVMAPTKPIFIAQTGTTAKTSSGISATAKNNWLTSAYTLLAAYPNLRGVMYFNMNNGQGYDWPFYMKNDPTHQFTGYRNGIAHPNYGRMAPAALKNAWP